SDPQRRGGGGVWATPTYDAETNRLFVTTGNIGNGLTREQQPWAQAVVAIDPITMETLDSWAVPEPWWLDSDFGASSTIYNTTEGRKMIAATNKNGVVYGWDRTNLAAGPVWTYRISGFFGDPDDGKASIVSAAYADGMLFVGGTRTQDLQHNG